MSSNISDILQDQTDEETIIMRENWVKLIQSVTEPLLDDRLSISTRIRAAQETEGTIVDAEYDASSHDVELEMYPHFVNYLKGLIRMARQPMLEENVCAVLWLIDNAIGVSFFFSST